MVYFTYSEGFRLGGDNNLRPNTILPNVYEPDKLFNHELGFKSTWFKNKVRFNATLFYMTWEDMQREVWDPFQTQSRGTANVGDAEMKGIEATLTYFITDDLKLDGSFYASDSQMTEDVLFSDIFDEGVIEVGGENDYYVAYKGQDLAIAPDQKIWIGIEYNYPEEFLGSSWWLRYDHSYQSSQSQDWEVSANASQPDDVRDAYIPEPIPSSQNANFQVGMYYGDSLQVTFSIWNVWDERSASWIDYGNDYALDQVGEQRFRSMTNYVRPREYTLSVSYNF
jgi:outer membrane receptor protein involved in Fe transport